MTFPPLIGTLLSDVEPEEVKWMWRGRIPLGKITVMDGDPGLGKSLITLDLASRVSTGREMPDGTPGVSGGVVLASGEDGLADTVRPRLDAAGADVRRIVDITLTDPTKSQPLKIPDEIQKLEQAILRVGAVLVVIDPVYSFLNERVNTDKDAHIRQALILLAKLAERLNVAVVLVRHLNKAEEKKALYRGGGSIGLIGLARSGLLVAKSRKSDGNVLASTKSNLAARPAPLLYRVEGHDDRVPTITWLGECTETADELTQGAKSRPRNKTEQTAVFLEETLSDGPIMSRLLEQSEKQLGISSKTYQRARALAGVESYETRDGWMSFLRTQMVRQSGSHGSSDSDCLLGGLA